MSRSVEVSIGGQPQTIEEPRLRRSKMIAKQVATLFNQVPNLEMEIETFSREWEQKTAYKLDRTAAKAQYGSRLQYEPELDGDGDPVLDADDNPVLVPKRDPETGEYVYGPDTLKGLSDEDWAGSGHVLPRYQTPSENAVLIHLFHTVYESAEEPLMELLGLMLVGNKELRDARVAGEVEVRKVIDEKRDLLEDTADLGDLVELSLETYKMLRAQIDRNKDKVGELRALLPGGKEQEPKSESATGTSGKPESSTSSSAEPEADTAGATTTSSSESSRQPSATSSS
jgi:hypothetical protein